MSAASDWSRVSRLFEAALDLSERERDTFLERACSGDRALLDEVRSLLEADAEPSVLDRSPDVIAPAAPETDPGSEDRVGPYRLIRRIGRGGTATVYEAVAPDGVTVALKRIRPGEDTDAVLLRFATERRVLEALDHPAIARWIDAGATADGRPYLVMERVLGTSIVDHCMREGLPTRRRLELFAEVCDAVAYAHGRLVVHRDLKPANVFVGEDGRPKILDFGTARVLDPNTHEPYGTATVYEHREMTPRYASPEQISGRSTTTATDVYGLGITLYEMLAERPAFADGDDAGEDLFRHVCEVDPPSPSAVARSSRRAGRRAIPREVDNIVLTAIRKDPERRYGSVEQLAEDVRNHLRGDPVEARGTGVTYRVAKFLTRHRVAVSALFATAVLSGTYAWFLHAQTERTAVERDRATFEREKADLVSTFLLDLFDADAVRGEAAVTELIDRGVAKIDRVPPRTPLLEAAVLQASGEVYARMGESGRALETIDRALALRRDVAGPGSRVTLDTAESLHHRGRVLADLGRFAEAERDLAEALAIREAVGRAGDPAVGVTWAELARVHAEAGREGPAREWAGRASDALRLAGDTGEPAVSRAIALTSAILDADGKRAR